MAVDIIARAEARIATLTERANQHDTDARLHGDRALECRLGIIELKQFLVMARDLAEDDIEPGAAMHPQTVPFQGQSVLAGQASVESPAPNTETSAATPGGDNDAPDAASLSEGVEPAQVSTPSPDHEPVAAGAPAETVDGGSRPSSPAPAVVNPSSKRELVRRAHLEHPDWTVRDAAQHLGLSTGSVSGHASMLGIKFAAANAKTMFRLRNEDGKYLHQSCQGLVSETRYAWQGTAAQIQKVRIRFPDALDLTEEIIR